MTSMRITRRQLEDMIVDCCHRMCSAGWLSSNDGNLTVKVADNRFLVTPHGISKACITRESLIVVDQTGAHVSGGRGEPFWGLPTHLEIHRLRPDCKVVLQARPPIATGLSLAGATVTPALLPEAVLALGARVPSIPYDMQSMSWLPGLLPHLTQHDAFILERGGVLTLGNDVHAACAVVELVEHLARVQLIASQVGSVNPMASLDVQALVAHRATLKTVKAELAPTSEELVASFDYEAVFSQTPHASRKVALG